MDARDKDTYERVPVKPHSESRPDRARFRLMRIVKDAEGCNQQQNTPENGKIEIELQAFVLDEDPGSASLPTYTALSYMWEFDSQNPTRGSIRRRISVQGAGRLQIEENLWQFLVAASSNTMELTACDKNQNHWFWIDAICINQNDVAEQNHQVGLMRRIYSKVRSIHHMQVTGTESIYFSSQSRQVRSSYGWVNRLRGRTWPWTTSQASRQRYSTINPNCLGRRKRP